MEQSVPPDLKEFGISLWGLFSQKINFNKLRGWRKKFRYRILGLLDLGSDFDTGLSSRKFFVLWSEVSEIDQASEISLENT